MLVIGYRWTRGVSLPCLEKEWQGDDAPTSLLVVLKLEHASALYAQGRDPEFKKKKVGEVSVRSSADHKPQKDFVSRRDIANRRKGFGYESAWRWASQRIACVREHLQILPGQWSGKARWPSKRPRLCEGGPLSKWPSARRDVWRRKRCED